MPSLFKTRSESCHAFVEMAGLHGGIPWLHPHANNRRKNQGMLTQIHVSGSFLLPCSRCGKQAGGLPARLPLLSASSIHSSPSLGWLAGTRPKMDTRDRMSHHQKYLALTELSPRLSLLVIDCDLYFSSLLFFSFPASPFSYIQLLTYRSIRSQHWLCS